MAQPPGVPIGGGLPGPRAGIRLILSDLAVRTVILTVFVAMLGFGIVAPILPLFARSFGVSYAEAALLISAFAFTRLVAGPISGPIVDRLGERRGAASGVAIVGASSVLTGLAPTFLLAVVFRGVGGAGSALLFTALQSYLLKVVPKDRMARTLGLFYGAFNLGVIVGAPLGGLIAARLGLASPLFFYAGTLFVAGALYLRFVRDPTPRLPAAETAHPEAKRPTSLGALLRQRAFVTTIFLNFSYLWMVAAVYETLVPLFAGDRLLMSPAAIGGVFALSLAIELLVLYPAGSVADRVGRKPVLVPSMVGLSILVAALGFSPGPAGFVVLMGALGVATGYAGIPPGAMLSDVAPSERSGTAVGIFRFSGDLGFVIGPVAVGLAASVLGFQAAFAIAAIPVAVGLVLALRTPETLRSP